MLRVRTAKTLFRKAQEANRVAHVARGKNATNAFAQKDRFLTRAFEVSPNSFILRTDKIVGRWVIELRVGNRRYSLHWLKLGDRRL